MVIGAHYGQLAITTRPARARIRLLAIMEGDTLSGPAKNLFEFCRLARELKEGPIIEPILVIFQRLRNGVSDAQCKENELVQQALQDEIPVHCIPERFTFDQRVMGYLKEIVNKVDPDIIQTHMFKSHFLVRVCGLHTKRAWVAFFHGYTSTSRRRELLAQLDRWSLQAPSQVVAVSEAFSHMLSSRGVPSSRIMVLHNAISPDWLRLPQELPDSSPLNSPPLVSQGEKVVLAVGRLSNEKAFPDLVAAIRYLKGQRPDLAVRLIVVGEGAARKTIEQAVMSAGLEKHVSLVGRVKDVSPYYRAADLLAISSLSEGSPNVLLEAMAAGVPVVSTAVGGIPEIVSHRETAFLVPPRNPTAMANAIEQLLSDRVMAEKMADRALESIKTRHSPLSRTKSLVRLYELLNSKTNGATDSKAEGRTIADSSSLPRGFTV